MSKKIPVTQPLLPPLEEFVPYLEQIWESRHLTNAGPFHEKLEKDLAAYLGVDHLCLFSNGTMALLTALQALRITGEVITTPYSFVATAHSLLWNGLKPVFVDIARGSFNLDPDRIEEAITPATTAIMPVHCYGTPCDVERIQKIADRYGLKVIYDAAHAFGVHHQGQSLLRHGDLSVLSFHATKVFNTFEGGAIVCPDAKTKQRIDYLKNFGFADEVTVVAPGINGKMSEINAAFGLLQLNYIDGALARRKQIDTMYREVIADMPGLHLLYSPNDDHNFSYFPVVVGDDFPLSRDELFERFRARDILVRRYFYPLISTFPMYRSLASAKPEGLKVATETSSRILCLPIFDALSPQDFDSIVDVLRTAMSEHP